MNLRQFKTVTDRRKALEKELGVDLSNIGSYSLDDSVASTRNCENMIGVSQVPLGVAGPLQVQSSKFKVQSYYLPLATTEGALVASVNRGCKAIAESGGAIVNSHRVGATRGPVFYTGGIAQNQKFCDWLKTHEKQLAGVAEQTSTHLRFEKFKINTVGRYAFIRFYFDTQDAMGMNMATIATQKLAAFIETNTQAKCLSVAGNYDVDKKPSWLNLIEGRGTKVWAEVVIPESVVKTVLKVTPQVFYEAWLAKCMYGSMLSGSLGFNAQFANIVAAVFLATGQDLGHIGEGSLGVTTTEVMKNQKSKIKNQKEKGSDLYISVYLPDLMVGTVGGGTGLPTQQEALKLLGVAGGNNGQNALQFAEIVTAAVLAGEISLLASEAEGTLAKAHQELGRGKILNPKHQILNKSKLPKLQTKNSFVFKTFEF